MITRDAGIPFQQNPGTILLTVIILPKRANALADIIPLVPALLTALKSAAPCSVVRL
jgi:hypothetical protein